MIEQLRQMLRQRRDRQQLYASAAYWDGKATALTGSAVSMWPNRVLNAAYEREQQAALARTLGSIEGLDVLDLGCGTGRLSRWLAERGARVEGVDFSAKALALARAQGGHVAITYREGSIFELEATGAYDVVFTWGVLTIGCQTPDELRDVLLRIRRALRSGGRLLLQEPIHRGFLHRVLDLDLAEFLAVLHEAGFSVERCVPLHFWPMRLLLAYVPWPAVLTQCGYCLGQWLMRAPGLRQLGDYHLIHALAAPASEAASTP